MHRVELKVFKKHKRFCDALMFLMHRVELKGTNSFIMDEIKSCS